MLDPSAPHFWTSPLEVLYYAVKTVVSAWMFFLNLWFLSFSTICIKSKAKLLKKHKTRRDRLVGAVLLERLAWKFVGAGEHGVGPWHFQDGRIEALGKGLGKGNFRIGATSKPPAAWRAGGILTFVYGWSCTHRGTIRNLRSSGICFRLAENNSTMLCMSMSADRQTRNMLT